MINVFQENDNVGMVGNVQKLAFSQNYDHMGMVFIASRLIRVITVRASIIDHLRVRFVSGVPLLLLVV